jgi:hypothetical protein
MSNKTKSKEKGGNGDLALLENKVTSLAHYNNPTCVVELALEKIDSMKTLATTLLRSGFLPEAINSVDKAVTIMLKGMELGVPMMTALQNIAVVKGKPVVQGNVMLALIQRVGGTWQVKKQTKTECEIEFKRPGFSTYLAKFTIEDAKQARLLYKKGDIWKLYPQLMLFWRAVAIGARTLFNDVIQGMYVPEELADVQVTADGEIEIISEVDRLPRQEEITPTPPSGRRTGTQKTQEPVRLPDGNVEYTEVEEVQEETDHNTQGNENESSGDVLETSEPETKEIQSEPEEKSLEERVKDILDGEAPADEVAIKKFKETMNNLLKRLQEIKDKDTANTTLSEILTKLKFNSLDEVVYRSQMERAWRMLSNTVEVIEAGIDLNKYKKRNGRK